MTALEIEEQLTAAVSTERLLETSAAIAQWTRHSGTAEERAAFAYVQAKLDEYGLRTTPWNTRRSSATRWSRAWRSWTRTALCWQSTPPWARPTAPAPTGWSPPWWMWASARPTSWRPRRPRARSCSSTGWPRPPQSMPPNRPGQRARSSSTTTICTT
ncbi:MAG: hypothetical protein R2851_03100 [Caldilineaceae bacterium]